MHVLKSKKERITLKYGKQTLNGKPYNHKGIDIIKKVASCDWIVAAQTGKVIAIQTNVKGYLAGSYGNYVMLEHGGGIRTLYAHLKYGTIKVKKGEIVKQGQVIGYMGNTGFSTGAHLHFEVRVNNKQVDPLPYLEDKKKIPPYVAPAKKVYKTATDALNLREAIGTKAKVIITIPKGKKVEILKADAGTKNGYKWSKVKYDKYTGYVASKYLK